MTLIYGNPQLGRRLDDSSVSYSRAQVLSLLRELRHDDAYLITTLHCGVGLDFHAQDDGTIWIEFYGSDGLHSATVSLATAEDIFERAYPLADIADTKGCFSDLIAQWDY